jgi:hypothetical protein
VRYIFLILMISLSSFVCHGQNFLVGCRPTTIIIPSPTAKPDTTTLVSPADGVDSVSTDTTFVWRKTDSTDTYTLQIDKDSAFATPDVALVQADTFRAVGGLDSSSTYYWRIRGTNIVGNAVWSPKFSFTTVYASAPAVPTLISPANGVDSVVINPLLVWTSVPTGTLYYVQISLSSSFLTTVLDTSLIGTTTQLTIGE